MQLHTIVRDIPNRKARAVGRGGKRGKTSGRGTKGQKARAGAKFRPAIRDAIKKLPKLRGYSFNSHRPKTVAINLSEIASVIKDGNLLDINFLIENNLLEKQMSKTPVVKLLGTGEITVAISVQGVAVSKTAEEKIKKAGGTIIL
jgi:large subunit ribosomal protein L15